MKITITHDFDISAEDFWTKIVFDDEHNDALYKKHPKFPEYTLLENRDDGNFVHRKIRAMPKQEAPAVVQKLLGNSFAYTEEGRFDKAKKVYSIKVTPSTMSEKVKTTGEFRVEALGPKKCRRVFECTIEVKVFGVGGMVESFVSKSMQDSYTQAAAFTPQWIKDKGL